MEALAWFFWIRRATFIKLFPGAAFVFLTASGVGICRFGILFTSGSNLRQEENRLPVRLLCLGGMRKLEHVPNDVRACFVLRNGLRGSAGILMFFFFFFQFPPHHHDLVPSTLNPFLRFFVAVLRALSSTGCDICDSCPRDSTRGPQGHSAGEARSLVLCLGGFRFWVTLGAYGFRGFGFRMYRSCL